MSHSAIVNMTLTVQGSTVRIAQMGPDFVLLPLEEWNRHTAPPNCNAYIRLSIDGVKRAWGVKLPEGINGQLVKIALI